MASENFNWKEVLIAVFMVVLAFLSGLGWGKISGIGTLELNSFLTELFVIILFSSVMLIAAVLVKNNVLFYAALVFSATAIFISHKFSVVYVIGIALCFLAFVFGSRLTKKEYAASARNYWRKIFASGLGFIIIGLAIAFSFIYYSETASQSDPVALFLPRTFFEFTLRRLEGPLQNFFPGFKSSATIDDFIAEAITAELRTTSPGQQIPANFIREAVRKQRQDYARQLGMNLAGGEKISDILYKIIFNRLKIFIEPFKDYAPFLVAVLYFILLWSVSVPVSWLIVPVAAIIIKFLILSGFARTEKTMVEKEIILL